MFMGKMIQVASSMERHLPQILNQQYFFFYFIFFNAVSVHILFVTSQDFGKQLF